LKRIRPASASCSQTTRMRPEVTASSPPKFMSDVGTQPVLLSRNPWIVDRRCVLILASEIMDPLLPTWSAANSAFAVDAGRVRLAGAADEGRAAGDTSRVSQRANNARANWSPASRTQSSRTMTNQATNAARSTQIAPIAAGLMAASALRSNGIDKLEMAGLTGVAPDDRECRNQKGSQACGDTDRLSPRMFRRNLYSAFSFSTSGNALPRHRSCSHFTADGTGRQQPWDRRPPVLRLARRTPPRSLRRTRDSGPTPAAEDALRDAVARSWSAQPPHSASSRFSTFLPRDLLRTIKPYRSPHDVPTVTSVASQLEVTSRGNHAIAVRMIGNSVSRPGNRRACRD
jgi:hypothetical protein